MLSFDARCLVDGYMTTAAYQQMLFSRTWKLLQQRLFTKVMSWGIKRSKEQCKTI